MESKRTQKMCLTIGLAFFFSVVGDAKADFTFGEPTNLGPTINSPHSDYSGSFSSDGLEMYFDSNRSSGPMKDDIYVSSRATTDDTWGAPVKLGPPVNSSGLDVSPIISTDGLSLYFTSLDRAGGYGWLDIWVATRATISDPWGEPSNLGPTINTSQDDVASSISCDGLVLYFTQSQPGGYSTYDIWVSTRATTNDAWGTPVKLGPPLNSSYGDGWPFILADGLLLFFHSNRPGGFGDYDLYMTTRPTIDDEWGLPVNLGPTINSSAVEYGATISPDGSTLFFTSDRPGGYGDNDIWQAPILPVVDFNGDGIVDVADVCILIDHWGENYSLCDIGPTPLGDGIVDVQDLIVLAEHLFEDHRLIAHWKLDEESGSIAYDSIQGHDGTCYGEPLWVPAGGKIDGALQFDGINDFMTTDFVLNPGKVSFSATAWIQGGAMDQVIISQADVDLQGPIDFSSTWSTWLGINSSDGRLMTGLMDIVFGPLKSESEITDGQWHHVGLVYDRDNLCRFLYVDGVEDARDTAPVAPIPLEDGGLFLGVGQNFDVGTFFSGLIDDIRIYNVALSAEEIANLVQ